MGSRLWCVLVCVVLAVSCCSAQKFTLIAMPDPQNEAQFYPAVLDRETQWIADNKTTLNIGAVMVEGDLVNDGADDAQLMNADTAFHTLDQAGIPYFVAIGNHDYDGALPRSRSVLGFNRWFGPARFAGQPWYGGSYPAGSSENSYGIVTLGGQPHLVLTLEYMPRPEAMQWAESVLAANADMPAIVLTHSYMFVDNTRVDRCDTQDMPAGNATGEQMWAALREHANVSLVLSGHLTNGQSSHRTDIGDAGNLVNQIFTNFQTVANGGNAYLRILTVDPAANSISVQTYSPYLNRYLTDAANQFTLYLRDPNAASGTSVVTGRVRDAATCKPIAGATVSTSDASAITDVNGRYTLTAAPGEHTITSTGTNYGSADRTQVLHDSFGPNLNFYLTAAAPTPAPPTPTPPPAPVPPAPAPPAAPAPDFSLDTDTATLSFAAGKSADVHISIDPLNGFSSAVSLACDGLPANVSCSFSTDHVSPGAPAVLTVATKQLGLSQQEHRPWLSTAGLSLALVFAGPVLSR
ncbi:MAG TPA: carboxypeptidase regulatory-like domain-containing protein, partial [Terriglobales bacterium]